MRSRLVSTRATPMTWSFYRRCHSRRVETSSEEDSASSIEAASSDEAASYLPVKTSLLKKLNQSRDALYLKDDETASRVLQRLQTHLRLSDAGDHHRFYEINPGPGFLSRQLLQRFPNLRLRCVEADERYKDPLTQLSTDFGPDRAEATFLDFFRVFKGGPSLESFLTVDEAFGRGEGGDEVDWRRTDDASRPPATLFGILPPYVKTTPMLSRIVEAAIDEESLLGRYAKVRFLIALPFARVPRWLRDATPLEDDEDKLLFSEPYQRRNRMGYDRSFVLVEYFFHTRPLMAFPLSSFTNAEKRDVGRVLVEFVAKDPAELSIPRRHWGSLMFFIDVLHSFSSTERVIPAMETFVPDIGPSLIMDDYLMMETMKDLSPIRRVNMYNHILQHPAFGQSIFGQVDSGLLHPQQWFSLTLRGRKGYEKIGMEDF